MQAEIIAVGTEILLGEISNTNGKYISEQLSELGVNVHYHAVVGDNYDRIKRVTKEAMNRSNLLIFTGGLGPTKDDLTKEAVSEVLGLPLVLSNECLSDIQSFFYKMNREMSENNKKQAMIPKGSTLIRNDNGTAPGIFIDNGEYKIALLPGPPHELQAMVDSELVPKLKEYVSEDYIIKSRTLKLIGIGESQVDEQITDLLSSDNPTVAPLAKKNQVQIRISCKGKRGLQVEDKISMMEYEIKNRLGKYIYGTDQDTLPQVVIRDLYKHNLTLAACESATGGLVSHELTQIQGASKAFLGSLVTYTNKAKETLLQIPSSYLERDGAVSRETTEYMAKKAKEKLGADIGFAVTGYAGPDGNQVGLTYFALSDNNNQTVSIRLVFPGNRTQIKSRMAQNGLNFIRKNINDE